MKLGELSELIGSDADRIRFACLKGNAFIGYFPVSARLLTEKSRTTNRANFWGIITYSYPGVKPCPLNIWFDGVTRAHRDHDWISVPAPV